MSSKATFLFSGILVVAAIALSSFADARSCQPLGRTCGHAKHRTHSLAKRKWAAYRRRSHEFHDYSYANGQDFASERYDRPYTALELGNPEYAAASPTPYTPPAPLPSGPILNFYGPTTNYFGVDAAPYYAAPPNERFDETPRSDPWNGYDRRDGLGNGY